MLYLSIAILAFIPAAVWLMIYYRKDTLEPEPKRLVWMTFWYGMLTAVPLVVFKYFIGMYPTLDPYAWFIKIFGFALAGILIVLVFALLEEYVKSLAFLVVVTEYSYELNQVVDGIIYGVAAALGFSFVENVVYLLQVAPSMDGNFIWVFLARAFGATFAHTLFTGFFGYIYAKACLVPRIVHTKNKHENPVAYHKAFFEALKLHILRTHILFDRHSERGHSLQATLAEALIVASLLHTTYNLLLTWAPFGKNLSMLIIPLLFVLMGIMWKMLAMKSNNVFVKNIKNVGTKILMYPEMVQRRRLAARDHR